MHLLRVQAGSPACTGGLSEAALIRTARKLLAFACDHGWAAVAARLMPLATAAMASAATATPGAATAQAAAATAGAPVDPAELINRDTSERDGLSILHRAVRSGSMHTLQVRGILTPSGPSNWGLQE